MGVVRVALGDVAVGRVLVSGGGWSAHGKVGVGDWGFRFGFGCGRCVPRPDSSCSKVLAKTSDRYRELGDGSLSGRKFVAVGLNTLAGMLLVENECLALGLTGEKLGGKGITFIVHTLDVGDLGRGKLLVHGGGSGSSGFSGCVSSKHGVVVLFVGSCAGSRLRLRAWGGRRGQVAVDRLGRLLGMLELLVVMKVLVVVVLMVMVMVRMLEVLLV